MSKLRKDKMSKAVENYERKINNNETIIKDLVSSFLVPNIERTKLQKTSKICYNKQFNYFHLCNSRARGEKIHRSC